MDKKIITVKAEDISELLEEAEISVTTKFDKVTVVCVKLKSGFVITEAAGAVDPRNYSEEIGKRVCLERIKNKLWEMEGYALQKLHPVAAMTDAPAPVGYRQYIGTKLIRAAPALRIQAPDGSMRIELLSNAPVTGKNDTVDMGYKVIYSDGYESWSPQDVFEAAYRQTDGLTFGLAIEAAKMGKKIARRGWNGKGMFVFMADSVDFHTEADLSEFQDATIDAMPAMVMRTAQRGLQPGWLASQADMLADDWYIVE